MKFNKKTLALCLSLPFSVATAKEVPTFPKAPECRMQAGEDKLAIVIVDMQEHFLNYVSKEELDKEQPNYFKILEYAKKKDIPVVVLEYRLKDYDRTIPELRSEVKSLDQKLFIEKQYNNGFLGTDLGKQLKCAGVEKILIMGIFASYCVRDTANGAVRAGFKVYASKDIIADREDVKRGESSEWFKKNTVFTDSYKDLLKILQDDNKAKNRP